MWLSSLSDTQRDALIRLAHTVVVSDGLLDPNEEFMLDEFKREMALGSKSNGDEVATGDLSQVFDTPRTRRIAIINLLRLSYVDGEFDVEEECLLKQIAVLFKIEEMEFRRMDSWVRRLMSLENEASNQFLAE
ncbi:MAG: TerB family tellurite resistance protein [Gammaproteobacteria bacterium]|nr:TerB family tellurite resistance protein [Gammaproteobacteria bacterium]MYD81669.1 TerB family tellurite resistance protein [Gammaproteobacteria bacterium]